MKTRNSLLILLLGVLCGTSPLGLSATTDSDEKWHKLSSQPFVFYPNKPDIDLVSIWVKKKIKYRSDMTKDEFKEDQSEDSRVSDFIKKLKGKITIYHGVTGSLEYEINFPIQDCNGSGFYFDINDDSWIRMSYLVELSLKKGTTSYIVYSEFYSDSSDFNDYMIGLEQIYGTK